MQITFYPLKDKEEKQILALFGTGFQTSSPHLYDTHPSTNGYSSTETCFSLRYESQRTANYISKWSCTIRLTDTDIHCYPSVLIQLIGFFDRLSSSGKHSADQNSSLPVDDKIAKTMPGFGFQRFGYSNFTEIESPDYATISLNSYPFITISNTGFLGSLESSLLHSIPDWRKVFRVREGKLRSSKYSLRNSSENLFASSLVSSHDMEEPPILRSSDNINQYLIDISMSGIRVHFHDSACVVGILTLPSSESSLLISEKVMDLLFSVNGLVLTSPWCVRTFHEFLWGPSLPNLSPILNVRVRKGNVLSSQLDVSIGIQHVCCVLPTEYLAIIIGYFSLPEWKSNSSEQMDMENDSVVYKFEVLDCTLILPLEDDLCQFLKVELQQLYCSNFQCSDYVLSEIPPECKVTAHKVAQQNNCLNIFGRDLFLSFVQLKDDRCQHIMFDQDTGSGDVIFIAPFSADVWVRIPFESQLTCENSSAAICVMSRIHNCQVLADGSIFYCQISLFSKLYIVLFHERIGLMISVFFLFL